MLQAILKTILWANHVMVGPTNRFPWITIFIQIDNARILFTLPKCINEIKKEIKRYKNVYINIDLAVNRFF